MSTKKYLPGERGAVKQYVHGTGMTQRIDTEISQPHTEEEAAEVTKAFRESAERASKHAGLEARLNRIEKNAKRILETGSMPDGYPKDADRMHIDWEPDSNGDFARRILEKIYVIRKQMGRGSWATAVDFALDVGALVTEFNFKKGFELDWQLGKGRRQQQTEFAVKGGEFQTEARKPIWANWQERADKKWAINPRLSKKQVAEEIAEETGGKPNTIRQRIKNTSHLK